LIEKVTTPKTVITIVTLFSFDRFVTTFPRKTKVFLLTYETPTFVTLI